MEWLMTLMISMGATAFGYAVGYFDGIKRAV